MKEFVELPKLKKGDEVGIVSPSADLAARWPWVMDLGIERLEKDFGLKAKVYPEVSQTAVSLKKRAEMLMRAFKDPDTKAVIATIGGQDQIKLLKYLDPEVFKKNPKPFFGFSDNTHFGNFLWNLGIPSYYGGCLMTQFGFEVEIPEFTAEYLNHALFDEGEFELKRSPEYNDVTNNWANKADITKPRKMETNDKWFWDGDKDAQGILWGGCMESMVAQMAAGVFLPSDSEVDGAVLFLESADGNTRPWIPEYLLTGFGERGWLDKFQAVLVGRPKAWELDLKIDAEEKANYRQAQRDMVLSVVREYSQDIPVIQNLDFGHTDPQVPIPKGNRVRIDGKNKKIFLTY